MTRNEEKWVQTGYSDKEVDTTRLAKDLQEAIENLNKDGYEVISVNDVISGKYNYDYRKEAGATWGYSYGYGYSYTDGLIVVARKA